MIVDLIAGTINPLVWLFFIAALAAGGIDLFWVQKRVEVDTKRAIAAAEQFHENR
jgi:hypothetical protein